MLFICICYVLFGTIGSFFYYSDFNYEIIIMKYFCTEMGLSSTQGQNIYVRRWITEDVWEILLRT